MWIKKTNIPFYVFIAVLAVGLLLAFSAYALDVYYKSHLIDKDNDGRVDWTDADVNGNGIVDIKDIIAIQQHFGPTTSLNSRYDLNGDGVVDDMDVAICASYYGSTSALSIFNLYSTQSKLFITGLVVTFLGFLGVFVYRPKPRR
jgi:hypothetical protein